MNIENKERLESTIDKLDKSAQNTQRLIEILTTMSEEGKNEKTYTEDEKRKAAYALNLCTVSVSQIIDYEDVVILEQEYELILNNLNLENMPKEPGSRPGRPFRTCTSTSSAVAPCNGLRVNLLLQ